jgi:hypothetical protein
VIVVADGIGGTLSVEDGDNLGALSVELRGIATDAANDALGDLGRVDEDHAWLNIDRLAALGRPPDSPGWDEKFQAMIGYARSHKWIDPTETMVRAHLAVAP